MTEGYTVEDLRGSVAGIIVRQPGERQFRFFSSSPVYSAFEGCIFGSAMAAQRAISTYSIKDPPLEDTAIKPGSWIDLT